MNVSCAKCPAKYAVPDAKVKGRKVRIKCKRCGAPIVVDGTKLDQGANGSAAPSAAPAARSKSAPPAASEPAPSQQPPPEDAPRKVAKTILGLQPGMNPFAAQPAARTPAPAPAARAATAQPSAHAGLEGSSVPVDDEPLPSERHAVPSEPAPKSGPASGRAEAAAPEPWLVAVTDDDQREMTTAELVRAFADGTVDEYSYIWREGMDDWLTAFEIPELATRLKALGHEAPRESAEFPSAAPAQSDEEPTETDAGIDTDGGVAALLEQAATSEGSGVWSEPGRPGSQPPPLTVESGGPAGEERIGFDDVTVAMTRDEIEAAQQSAPTHDVPLPPPRDSSPTADFEDRTEKDNVAYEPPFEVEPPRRDSGVALAQDRSEHQDLFGQAAAAGSEEALRIEAEERAFAAPPPSSSRAGEAEDVLTGARNESSVLFSLDALVKSELGPDKSKNDRVDEDSLFGGGSSGNDDALANLGSMGSPDFSAPPSGPGLADIGPGSLSPPVLSGPEAPVKKSGGGGWIFVALLVVLVAGIGGWAYQQGLLAEWIPALKK